MKVLYCDLWIESKRRYCSRGARAFAQRHGYNWMQFLEEGIDVALIEHIDDEMVKTIIENCRKRVALENGGVDGVE